MGLFTRKTNVITTLNELRAWRSSVYKEGQKSDISIVGFVPTMGALHAGHQQLIQQARKSCGNLVVSIFVNPLQFGPNEDFDKYPRTFENDLQCCIEEAVDVVFHPTVEEVYSRGQTDTTKVLPPSFLSTSLLGEFRPAFFGGVATIVTRLFNMVQPQIAFFGEKDYQQLLVVRRMVQDLQMPITVAGVPTVREKDGLAYSSRNFLLTTEQRNLAPILYRVLCFVRDNVLSQKLSLREAITKGASEINKLPDVSLKYLVACDPDTLQEMEVARLPMVLLIAAKFADIWLIDTLMIQA